MRASHDVVMTCPLATGALTSLSLTTLAARLWLRWPGPSLLPPNTGANPTNTHTDIVITDIKAELSGNDMK